MNEMAAGTRSDEILSAFAGGRSAFMPYLTLGYPDMPTSVKVALACEKAGADILELGIPFSDPLADGPTIQMSTQKALERGATVARCMQAIRIMREEGVTIPLMLMGYINPILAFGIEEFCDAALDSGANGFIIPDLPPEEGGSVQHHCQSKGLGLSYLLAPNSPPERIELVVERTIGFVYLVSLLGITGARNSLQADLGDFVGRVRLATDKPIAVGFGISTPGQAAVVAKLADGVIVGSALIRAMESESDPIAAAANFCRTIRAGMDSEDLNAD